MHPADRARRFFNDTPEHAALLLSEDGTIEWANPAAAVIFSDNGLVGRHVSACFAEEDVEAGIPEMERTIARASGLMEDDRWMRRADGSRFWAEGDTVALRDGPGGFVKLLRNRTTQKMAMETLRNQYEERARHSRHCETAMATLAHELRNPLASIKACGHLLERLPTGDDRIAGTYAILGRNVGEATRLLEDLLDASRGATGKMGVHVESIAVDEMLRTAIRTAQERARTPRRVDLFLPDAPGRIEADPLRMQQVFVNLVGNALRYTPSSGRVWVTAVALEDNLLVKVQDTGIGMTPEVLVDVFQMFSQASDATFSGGLGIGLALVKQIVELHGGSVQAQSDGLGHGSKFLVTLPIRQPPPDAAPVGIG